MTNKKISELTAATSINATDTFPMVQSGATKKVPASVLKSFINKIWTPSDITGATDVTVELEAFAAANPGFIIKVPDNAIIKLKNAFKLVTTGDVLIDFGQATILYDSATLNDAAIYLDNSANASSAKTVNSIALSTVNSDALVTQLTLAATLNAKRFDWVAFYTADANPAKSGGVLGEIFQVFSDESSLVLAATRKLNRHSQYNTGMTARKLDASRRVFIKGGRFTANGDPESHTITARSKGIVIRAFVDPMVQDITFDKPWAQCVQFIACAAPRWDNIVVRNVGNMANYNGYIYGVQLYGMNDCADGRNIVVRNGRHAGFTTDGDSNNSTTWTQKGIPTNFLVDGVHGYNCNASVVDTHEEGDGGHITNVTNYFPYQDEDISPNFSGITIQSRCANTRFSNIYQFGGTGFIKVNNIDHGFEDRVMLDNVHVFGTTSAANTDTAINIADQSALTNKRHVYLDRATFTDVGKCISIGKTAKLTIGDATARGCAYWLDTQAGSSTLVSGDLTLSFRTTTRAAPYYCNVLRSDVTYGGASVIYLRKPVVIKGDAANKPTYFFEENDTNANKTIWAPGVTEYNPNGVTPTNLYKAAATTFVWANVTNPTNEATRTITASGSATDSDKVVLVNGSAAVALAIPKAGYPGRTLTIKDIAGNAGTYNTTVTPTSGTIDGQASLVINSNWASYDLLDTGSTWVITRRYTGTSATVISAAPFIIPFNNRADSSMSLTALPVAEQFFPLNSKRTVMKYDLTGYTKARLVVNVAGGATTNGKLMAKYKTSFTYSSDVATSFSDLGQSEISCSLTTQGLIVSSWIDLAPGALADVFLALTHSGGDATNTPTLGSVYLELK